MNAFFEEIKENEQEQEEFTGKYRKLAALTDRLVVEMTRDFAVEFTSMTGRLYTLCRTTGYEHRDLARFRKNATEVARGIRTAEPEEYAHDLKAVCEAVAFFTGEPVPEELRQRLPLGKRAERKRAPEEDFARKIRITVTGWDDTFVYGADREQPDGEEIRARYRQEDGAFDDLTDWLYEGAQLNLLSVTFSEEEGQRAAHPKLLILDPDFLIDITAICQCYKPYGCHVLNHLINKFTPAPRSAALQLGNLANQFLDACVHDNGLEEKSEAEAYQEALLQSFETSPIEYTTLPDINQAFFEQARRQFHHIREVVRKKFTAEEIDIERQDVQLEPSFLCEALGLQGRLDLLVNDSSKIVELKSGKADEFPKIRPKEEHALQMALYKEILYYNMEVPHDAVQTYLLYSRYPLLYHIRHSNTELRQALALRNRIVGLERMLRDGHSRQVVEELDEQVLVAPEMRESRFYRQYLRQDLTEMIGRLKNAKEIEKEYFHTFLAFMEREQFLSKIGDDQPDSGRGFAELWNRDTVTKQGNGNILTDLKLTPLFDRQGAVTGMDLEMPEYAEDFLPNFRNGDSVLLYERNTEQDSVVNKQVFRCQIEEMGTRYVRVRLAYKQKNAQVFHPQALYALEPGYADSSYTQAYRGLYSLLLAPQERRDLILGQRKPVTDRSIALKGKFDNPEIGDIVRKAMQAKDYFLLVGPPGTGKTSVALKAMVEELLRDSGRKNLLLMAYTNRAVDEICQMLEGLDEQPEYVRIGQELNCEPAYRHRLIKYKIREAQNRKQIFDLLEPVQIFVGTISSMAGRSELFELKRFDTAIIDEASQVLEPQLLPLLCATTSLPDPSYRSNPCAIGKFILIGDHKQLPAVVLQNPARSEVYSETLKGIGLTNCRNSLFERLHTLQQILHTEQDTVAWLHRQGRMHEDLSEFVNRHFYNRQLGVVPLPHQQGPLPHRYEGTDPWKRRVAERRLDFIPVVPTEYGENNKVNREEATVIGQLVEALYRLHEQEKDWNPARQIGIIVPFRGQIAMIRKELEERKLEDCGQITIDTVERYQGSQRDVILFSTTIRQPYQLEVLSAPVQTEGQWVDRKLNVALTRARKQFFMTGNPVLLERAPAYRELIDYIQESIKKYMEK